MNLEVERWEGELKELRKAAQAVVDRWDTPLWKDVPATANYINDLRNVLLKTNRTENQNV